MLTWEIVTEKVEAEAKAAAMGADTAAVNQLLMEMGRATTEEQVAATALEATRDAFGFELRHFSAHDSAENVLAFSSESGSVTEFGGRATTSAREGRAFPARPGGRATWWWWKISLHAGFPWPGQQRVGLKSAVCLPVFIGGSIAGAIELFSANQQP